METILNYLQLHVPWLIQYKYLFLFIGSAVEGLNSMVFGGFLAALGAVNILAVFVVMTIGHTLNGYIWYAVGFWGGSKPLDRWGHREKKSHEIIQGATRYFNKYSGRAIMITKFTFSFQIATLITAGTLKYNLREFAKYNFLGSLGWTIITISIGYVFGEGFGFFGKFIENLTYFILFLAGAITLVYVMRLLFKSAFVKSLRLQERFEYWNGRLQQQVDKLLIDNGSKKDHKNGTGGKETQQNR